jgi:hypothetical protein
VDGNGCDIWGQGKASTILQYTGTSGTSVSFTGAGDPSVALWGMHHLNLIGPGTANTAKGVLIAAPGVILDGVEIGEQTGADFFSLGLTFGSTAYLDRVVNSQIWHNTQNVYFPGGLSVAGENVKFDHTTISNGGTYANCAVFGTAGAQGPEVSFIASSFDTCQLVNSDSFVSLTAPHFEDGATSLALPFVTTVSDNLDGRSGTVGVTNMTDVQVYNNNTMTSNGVFEVDRYGTLKIDGFNDFANSAGVPLVYLNTNTGGQPTFEFYAPDSPRGATLSGGIYPLYSIASNTQPLMNIHTAAIHESSSNGPDVFAYAGGLGYLKSSALARINTSAGIAALGFYTWSGVGQAWNSFQLQSSNNGQTLSFCHGGSLNATNYSMFGTESNETCDSSTTQGTWNALGYEVNGNLVLGPSYSGYVGSGGYLPSTNFPTGSAVTNGMLKTSSDGTIVYAPGLSNPVSGELDLAVTKSSVGYTGTGTSSLTLGGATIVGSGASTPTCITSCNQFSGEWSFQTGSSISAAGFIATIGFPASRTNNPSCLISVINTSTNTPFTSAYVTNQTVSTAPIYSATQLLSGDVYYVTYICGGV